MYPKVSIVVPIYKVEKYLNRCLDTIVNQTYTNLEIILVDDGSPDNCGKIADEYAQNDCRIKVNHKKNGGLSSARNSGMELATGDFTLFVDSDDWLEKNMIEKMLNISNEFKADVVQSAFYYAYDDHFLFDNRFYQKESPPIVLDNKSLMAELVVNERVKNFAWGKLYKMNVIKDIPFKEGVLFEDVFWAHKVMHRVNTYVILNQPLCYYFQRSDSIVTTYTPKNLDMILGLKERQCFIEEHYKELSIQANKVLLNNILIHYNLLLINRKKDKEGVHRRELQQYIKTNLNKFKNAAGKDNNLKVQLILFSIHPYFNIFFLILRKIFRRLGICPIPKGLEKTNL
ncbi:glycosyltransferase [Neobacillus sp. PS3-40]|uniref:glycosyltransferase family 2 protein n=1 Tax=Neobacillus sp. PS3-40 TaxID=3070679 RepID=UPI0027E06824|nr:glycosyltransferase [Neobacillus sp. PS3-40]WML45816.1 glycosyltransferase [Neobacillus sp. PS3-40]